MKNTSECYIDGKLISMQEICSLQRDFAEAYIAENGLERREGAKLWVQRFSKKCRELLEKGVKDRQDLERRLYQ
ncbi:hypothetical protein LAT59_00155 [Candidatus Gracilibacteria bacterium]|nr:hypothetical protein [Candidatus Gracilibacteria bacterium]